MTWYNPINNGIIKIIEYEIIKFIDKDMVNLVIISFNKKIENPIEIEINKTLKKFSFLWNLLVNPTITNAKTTINKGFNISEI